MRKKEKQLWEHLVSLFLSLIILVLIQPGYVQAASSYTADWQRWSQGASGYSAMKYGCRVTAYSKMLAEAGYAGFGNPDGFFEWGMARGYFRASDTCELTSIGVAPVTYVNNSGGAASLAGRQALTGNKTTDANTIMNLINQGYYVVLTCTEHTAYVGRAASLSQGTAVLLDSWSSRKEGPSFQYRSYTQYTFKTANYFRITTNSTPADTTPPVISDVRVTDMNADGYTVTCRVEDAGGVERVQFPTWTTYGDQDDLMASWWDSDRCRGTQNGTTWSYRVNASDHNNEEGYYNTHIYAWDAAGNSSYVHVNGIYVDRTPPVISEVQVVDADATGYTVTCRVEDAGGVARVQFPTWTTYGDQDDLMANWWDSDRCRGTQNVTTWSYRVNASDHNNEEGFYNTHIYAWDAAGNSSCVSVNGNYVDRTPPVISEVKVVDVDVAGYTVTCKVEDASSGIMKVQFPTWTPENGQDDLAENWWDNPICSGTQNGTTWSYRVNVSDHNNEEGVYRTHIYAYDNAGNRTGAIEVADVLVEKEKTEGADKTGEPQNPGTENAGKQDTITFSINAFDNLDYTFQTIDGGNVSSKALASKDVTLLVFGRTTCASTWLTLKSIAESSWIHGPEVSVVYVEIEGADAQAVKGCIDRYAQIGEDASQYRLGCEKIVFCHDADNKNEEARKMYHALSGKRGTIYLPMTVFIDRNNVVREILTNYQTADEILPVMNQVIAKGNAAEKEEDKKEDTDKKDDTDKKEDADKKTEAVKASNVHLSRTSLTWNGKRQRPSVIARDSQGRQIGSADYTVTYSSNKSVGQATATISFKNNYKGTVKKTFLIKPKGTSISRLTPKKKGFAVKWKKQASQTTGYELQYCINSKFKGAKTLKNIKAITTSKSITKLKAKKKYYVRIRTYKNAKVNGKITKIYSGWSKAKKVIAKK